MFKNNLKIALRYLLKNRGYTLINVFGLAVGIASCILIALFVKSEWSFDRMHAKADRIHRAWLQEHYNGHIFTNVATPIPLGPLLSQNLPEVEKVTRIANIGAPVIRSGNTYNLPVTLVDSTFFEVFDFSLIRGGSGTPFPDKNSVILTEETARMLFGKAEVLGETLELKLGEDTELFTVTGVAEDPPFESSIQFDLIIPFENAVHIWSEYTRTSAWSNVSVGTYVLLREGVTPEQVEKKIPAFMQPLVAENYKPGAYNISLQPLTDMYLNSQGPQELPSASDPLFSYILACVGILILLIACVNFITLSLGRSTTRALEVGVRKVLGAQRKQLIWQFWGESFLLTLLALVLGTTLAILFLDSFNQMANRDFVLSAEPFLIAFALGLLLFISMVAGSYPALVLSSFQPIKVLKGRFRVGSMGWFGKGLVISQFVASIVMIIFTMSVGEQLEYLQTKDLGFQKEHIIVVPTNRDFTEGSILASRLITALEGDPQVVGLTKSLYSMGEFGWMQLGYTDNSGVFRMFRFNAIDPDFVETMGLKILEGRDFRKNTPADSSGILVNETLVAQYGWEDPIGKKLPGAYPQEVIGVVEDFHIESLYSRVQPVVMALNAKDIFANSSDVTYDYTPQPRVSVKFREGSPREHLALLEEKWEEIAGDQEFQYQFLDDELGAAYAREQRLSRIVRFASTLSILIACMGLFGLATLVVARRRKEIGIRKVLGAGVVNLVVLLTREFVVHILVASLIAFPLAWLLLERWLRDFAYRIDMPLWAFAGSAMLVLLIALVTVSVQSVKAALHNPVGNLRSE